jgi:hypothetical protein
MATLRGYFVCEWDRPGAAPAPVQRRRVATRGAYVIMNSFDDPAADALMERIAPSAE